MIGKTKTGSVIEWFYENKITSEDAVYLHFHFLSKQPYDGYPFNLDRKMPEPKPIRYTVDIMVVTDRLIGIEIMTDNYYPVGRHPMYTCISGAENTYNNFFDEMWVCCTPKSFESAHKNLPENVGIFIFNKDGSLFVSRIATKKPDSCQQKIEVSNHLTKKEMMSLCAEHNVLVSTDYNKPMLCRYMSDIPYSVITAAVTTRLKKRFHRSKRLQKNLI